MSKGQNKKTKVFRYLSQHPESRTAEAAQKLGVNPSYISTLRNSDEFRDLFGRKQEPTTNGHFKMSLDIGVQGAEIKVLSKGRMIGTLVLSEKGVQFRKSNAKKPSDRNVIWPVLEKLMELGIV